MLKPDLDGLRRLGRKYQRARANADQATIDLAKAIVAATAAGATRRAVAEATGLSFQRVQQIVEGRRA